MTDEVKLFIQFKKDAKRAEGLKPPTTTTHTHTHAHTHTHMANPPLPPRSIFPNFPLVAVFRQYRGNEIWDKHKNKLMRKS